MEKNSEHPLGQAIVVAARDQGEIPEASNFQAVPGQGVRATVDGHPVLVGNRIMLVEAGIDITALRDTMETLENDGKTAMLVAVDGSPAGVVAVADTVKEHSAAAINVWKRTWSVDQVLSHTYFGCSFCCILAQVSFSETTRLKTSRLLWEAGSTQK